MSFFCFRGSSMRSAGFARYFSQHGFTPGLVVVQSAMGFTWQITGDCGDFSGIAQAYRACHLWYGAAAYVTQLNAAGFPYGFSSNVCHEMATSCIASTLRAGERAEPTPPATTAPRAVSA